MKKLLIFLGCIALPILMSCDREVEYDQMYSAEYDIRSSDWAWVDSYYTVALDVKQITRQVCSTGSVQCFIVYSDGSQACLPLQRYLSYEYTDDTGQTATGYYSKMIDFEYGVGTVNIFYQMSDFYYEESPEAIRIRVVVHY